MKPRAEKRCADRSLRVLAMLLAMLLAPSFSPPAMAQGAASDAASGAAGLAPYKARYQVSYRGISGGELETTLHRGTAQGQWLYESRAYPNLLARVAVSPDARQRSSMDVAHGAVRPQSLVFDDGSDSGVKDVRMTFDWPEGRVRGESKGKPFDVPLQPGTQDSTSVQVAMLLELVAGHEPKSFRIQNGARLEEYRYWPEGNATVVTPFGKFETVVWASQRDGSKRVNRVWHAPSLGYVPVQAIQFNKGRPDVQMRLVGLER